MSSEPRETQTPENQTPTEQTSAPAKRRVYLVTPSGEKYLHGISKDLKSSLGDDVEFLKPEGKKRQGSIRKKETLGPEDKAIFKELLKDDNNRQFSGKELRALARGMGRARDNQDPNVEYVLVSGDGREQDLISKRGGRSLHSRAMLDQVAESGKLEQDKVDQQKKHIEKREQKRLANRQMKAGLSALFGGMYKGLMKWATPKWLQRFNAWRKALSSKYREGREQGTQRALEEAAGRAPRPYEPTKEEQQQKLAQEADQRRQEMMEALRAVLRERDLEKKQRKQEQEQQPSSGPKIGQHRVQQPEVEQQPEIETQEPPSGPKIGQHRVQQPEVGPAEQPVSDTSTSKEKQPERPRSKSEIRPAPEKQETGRPRAKTEIRSKKTEAEVALPVSDTSTSKEKQPERPRSKSEIRPAPEKQETGRPRARTSVQSKKVVERDR